MVNACQLVENTAKLGMTNTTTDPNKAYARGSKTHYASEDFDYPAVDTGGTSITSSFGTPLITGMPSSRVANVVSCGPSAASPGTTALTAGTRTLSNQMYTTTAIVQNTASTSQPGSIWQLTWNEDEPMVLLANEGFEYQIPMGLTLSQNKNLTVNMISTWMEVPREIIYERYGI